MTVWVLFYSHSKWKWTSDDWKQVFVAVSFIKLHKCWPVTGAERVKIMREHNTQLNTIHACSKNPQIKKIMEKVKHTVCKLVYKPLHSSTCQCLGPFQPICPSASLRTGALVLQRLWGWWENDRTVTATLPAHFPQHTNVAALSPLCSCGVIQRSDLFFLKEESHLVPQNDNATMILLLFTRFVVVLKHASQQIWDKYWKVFEGEKKCQTKSNTRHF